MSNQYVGEIRIFAFGIVPRGWQMCNGQILSIQQNAALFSILGTTYGGNGVSTFALPNFQGRVPVHTGGSIQAVLGEVTGSPNHTLLITEIPLHNHLINTAATGSVSSPTNAFPAPAGTNTFYNPAPVASPATLHTAAMGQTGGSQPHNNMAPYLVLNFCIATTGIFPSRN